MNITRQLTKLPNERYRDALSRAAQARVIETVLAHYDLTFAQAAANTRNAKVLWPRHVIHYLLSVNSDQSFYKIGLVFKKNHATVICSRAAVEDMIATNKEFRQSIETIITKIINQ